MNIGVVREDADGERRVGLVPATVKTLVAAGHTVTIEQGAGLEAGFNDEAYSAVEASIADHAAVIGSCSIIVKVGVPTVTNIMEYKRGTSLISFVYPRRNPEILAAAAEAGISLYAMDAMPRITRAQNMDVLSSQNNLAGYKAVIVGANALGSIFPMMTTAAGTLRPAKVVVFGAGVAGLQAVATAKRLGAVVEVTDIRPETREQVESLGGRFIIVEGLDEVTIEGGYVAEVGASVLAKQQEAVNKSLAKADLVITTALVAGGTAPTLISDEQLALMRRGSVIVDIATEAGGNCASSRADETVTINGVTIIGCNNLAATVPTHASELYAKNIVTYLTAVTNENELSTDVSDEIVSATLVVHNGEVRI